MVRAFSTDDPVVQATADILENEPELTNARVLQRLAAILGASVTQEIPVTHFQSRVRTPAERLLWNRRSNGGKNGRGSRSRGRGGDGRNTGSEVAPGGNAAPEKSPAPAGKKVQPANGRKRAGGRTTSPSGKKRGSPSSGPSRAQLRAVDEALERAFQLGVASESEADVTRKFQELDQVKSKLRDRLSG